MAEEEKENAGKPAEGEGEKQGAGKESEELAKTLEDLTAKNQDLTTKNEDLSGRVETLQDSLDNVLEELSLRGHTPSAEGEGEGAEGEEEKGEGGEAGAEELEKEKEGEVGTLEVEKEIEKSIKEDEEYRTEQQEVIEGILTREAVRDLSTKMEDALKEYPNASEGEVLLAIEDGSEDSVMDLAKASHEKISKLKDEEKVKIEEDFKERLKKEGEGGISVPQSPGSSSAPKTPKQFGEKPQNVSEDSEWGNALEKAKVEGGGA